MALVTKQILDAPIQHHFSPYSDNGGTTVAVAGPDYALIASDTRLSAGFNIYTREQSKLFPLSEKTVLGSSGCWCDILSLSRIIEARMQMYLHEHNKTMSTTSLAKMISIMMYGKRFFPYYTSTIIAGLDNEGKGAVYSYDPIGHTQRSEFESGGSSGSLLQALLDNQLGFRNQENVDRTPVPLEKAITIVRDAFISAAERDIYTGDGVHLCAITKDGIKEYNFSLRKD